MGDEGLAVSSAGVSGGGDEAACSHSQQSSPKGGGRVKFFCSHGGKILPRPSDGVLKYVGGETRIVGVPRIISFSGLMKKITELFEGEFVIKYQIGSVDLDALVSVKTDEDLHHMLDEYDRLESTGNPKLRVFLFPKLSTTSHQQQQPQLSPLSIPQSLEQRYLDAINGIVRSSNQSSIALCMRPPSVMQSRLRSVCTSPTDSGTPSPHSPSPPSMVAQNSLHNLASDASNFGANLRGNLSRMHKVHSSPSLCSLGSGIVHQSSNTSQLGGGKVQFQQGRVAYPDSLYGHGYHHQQQLHTSPHYHQHSRSGYRSPGSRVCPSMGREECAGAGNYNNHQHSRMGGSPTGGFYGMISRGGYLSPGHNRRAHLGGQY